MKFYLAFAAVKVDNDDMFFFEKLYCVLIDVQLVLTDGEYSESSSRTDGDNVQGAQSASPKRAQPTRGLFFNFAFFAMPLSTLVARNPS